MTDNKKPLLTKQIVEQLKQKYRGEDLRQRISHYDTTDSQLLHFGLGALFGLGLDSITDDNFGNTSSDIDTSDFDCTGGDW